MRNILKQSVIFLSLIFLAGSLAAFELGINRISQKKDKNRDQRFSSDKATDFILTDSFSGSNRFFPAGTTDISADPTVSIHAESVSGVHLFSLGRSDRDTSGADLEKNTVPDRSPWRDWAGPSPLLPLLLASPEAEQPAGWTAPRFQSSLDMLAKR